MININELKEFAEIEENSSFKKITSIRIGGDIKYIAYPKNIENLKKLIDYLLINDEKFKVVGKGSNILACDKFYDGVVIRLNKMQAYKFEENTVYCEAGVSAIKISTEAMKKGLSNLEFISGIPGTIGGLVYMNAGAYKQEIKDILIDVLVYKDGEVIWMKAEELEFAYRFSSFMKHKNWIVLACRLKLVEKDSESIKSLMDDRLKRRTSIQPLDLPSCGSCFKNPENTFAWKLIEGIGMRGFSLNGLEVSSKHPNFIVNKSGGKFDDFIYIVDKIKKDVKQKYDVDLHLEAEIFKW